MERLKMNKKGFFSMITIFVLIMVIVVLAAAQHKVDTSNINKAIETLNWSNIGQNVSNSMRNAIEGTNNTIVKTISEISLKAVDLFGYTIFAVTKLAMELARDNPNIINYKVLLALIVLSLLAPLIYPMFIIIVSLILIVWEAIQNRREKKELNKLLNKSNG
jgi:hypothetical protein